ncbi:MULTISPECIES: YhcN/YlaJ family sporulation lipoprotein [Paenibacillus]|uniref:Sporulation protein n=1 Tax=Paenibacillus lautus TaxID=1401 RepID=A0A1R1B2K7_PAELA|nr:YhcN/YlaJ family sporulation lipoprotein [Paenibacillus lautus]OME93046.1 sporulation protein [Paenibacillus lautus]
MIKSKALNLTVSTALLLSMAAVAGCGNTTDGKTTRTQSVDGGRVGVKSVRNNNLHVRSTQQHDLTNLKYSKTLSKKVSDLGVGTAHVFVTNHNAYVSLSKDGAHTNNIDGHVTGMSTPNRYTDGRTTTGMNRTNVRNRTFGTSSTGSVGLLNNMARGTERVVGKTTRAVENTTGLGRTADNRGFGVNGTTTHGGFGGSNYNTLNGTRTNGLMGTNGTRTDGIMGTRTDGLTGTDGIRTNSLTGTRGTTNNTYMGTGINGVPYGTYNNNNMGMMSTREEVPQHVRHEITSKIRKTAPHISQVYVSTDEGFYQHARRFGTDGHAANTVGTLSRDFGTWINRVFPLHVGGRDGMNDTRGNLMKNDTDDGWFGGNRNSR